MCGIRISYSENEHRKWCEFRNLHAYELEVTEFLGIEID